MIVIIAGTIFFILLSLVLSMIALKLINENVYSSHVYSSEIKKSKRSQDFFVFYAIKYILKMWNL